jgi:diguanylate cyclase (GGDEF)-like protein
MARPGSPEPLPFRPGLRLPALLLVAGLLVILAAILANHLLAERLLAKDSQATGQELLTQLAQGSLAPNGPPGVLTWRLLDAEGREIAAQGPSADPGVLRAGSFKALRLPHGDAGHVLEAVVDQTERRARYREAFFLAELAIAVFGVAAGGLLIWSGLRRQHSEAAEARAMFFRRHDALTGLATHAECRERLDAAVALGQRQGFGVGVLVLDLRRFRDVNDTLGRAGGDTVLGVIAARLSGTVRREDTVARLSADRFAVIQSGIAGVPGATRLAERLIALIAEPVVIEGGEVICAVDIGIAVAPQDGTSAEILLARAEAALGVARAGIEPGISCFEHSQDDALRQRRETERDLKRALAEGQFTLHWQPQRNIADGRLTGFEALVRWNHPTRGLVPPNDFIPIAESSGLIVPLGAWVLRAACAEAATWPGSFQAAVNLSPAQFRHGALVATVAEALASTGLPPARLELEITESLLQHDPDSVVGLLRELRGLGVNIAMDDFGTGWSSLAHLWRFPFGKLKIDRAFVKNLARDPKVSAIVATIVGLGRTLDMQVIAEGVETEEQARLLLAKGCEHGQGWLYGKPLPAEAARATIATELHERARSAA